MKTYILPDPSAVEPQKPLPAQPQTSALVEKILAPSQTGPGLYVGLDVHNDSIAVSLASSDSTEVRRYGRFP